VKKILEGKGAFGYNARTGEFSDLVEDKVIDPAKVVRIAVENSTSIAGLILTTECVIAEKKKEKKDGDKKPSSNYSGSIE
jgi:chaperonin GroEL